MKRYLAITCLVMVQWRRLVSFWKALEQLYRLGTSLASNIWTLCYICQSKMGLESGQQPLNWAASHINDSNGQNKPKLTTRPPIESSLQAASISTIFATTSKLKLNTVRSDGLTKKRQPRADESNNHHRYTSNPKLHFHLKQRLRNNNNNTVIITNLTRKLT